MAITLQPKLRFASSTSPAEPRSKMFRIGYYSSFCTITVLITLQHRDVGRVCENIPMVLVGNKVDMTDRVVKPKNISYYLHPKDANGKLLPPPFGMYYEISAKSNYNFEKPFLYLARKFFGVRFFISVKFNFRILISILGPTLQSTRKRVLSSFLSTAMTTSHLPPAQRRLLRLPVLLLGLLLLQPSDQPQPMQRPRLEKQLPQLLEAALLPLGKPICRTVLNLGALAPRLAASNLRHLAPASHLNNQQL